MDGRQGRRGRMMLEVKLEEEVEAEVGRWW